MAQRHGNQGGAGSRSCLRADGVDEERLVNDHLPLVQRAVSDMLGRVPRHVSRADLVSAAMAGLAQAARAYDPTRGIAFDRFASTRIRGALLDELRSRDWASRSVRARARSMTAAVEDLTASLGAAPTADQLAAHLGIDRPTLDSLSGDVHRATVLNFEALVADGDGSAVLPADERAPDTQLIERERRAYLVDAVAALPERMRHVVVGYFFDERPMKELAEELGVTESRISQIRGEALAMLRGALDSHLDGEDVLIDLSPRAAKRTAAYIDSVGVGRDWKSRLAAVPTGPRLTTLN
ncbi:MAG TPA: sigma-70 family RNA polymerase sigma factor [Acidimicrobiales bacterium]|nr:sigma-70 family RNA polymerase sigma factor [Acidimicrobiales bacterium]